MQFISRLSALPLGIFVAELARVPESVCRGRNSGEFRYIEWLCFSKAKILNGVALSCGKSGAFWLVYGMFLCAQVPFGYAAGPLRYALPAGKSVVYDVEILADVGDELETLKGNITFSGRSIQNDILAMTFQGGLQRITKPKEPTSGRPRGFGFPPPPPLPRFGGPFGRAGFGGLGGTTNELTMTSRGAVQTLNGESQLPHLLGNLSVLIFEPLPQNAERTWSDQRGISVTQDGGRPAFAPSFVQGPSASAAGSEESGYSHDRDEGPVAVITKTVRLSSSIPGGGINDRYEITGNGTWKFNRQVGMPESMEFKQKLLAHEGNKTTTTQLVIKYRRLGEAEQQKLADDVKKRHDEMQKKLADQKAAAEAPLSANDKTRLISDLRSENTATLTKALAELASRSPKDSDPEVAGAIEALIKHSTDEVRSAADRAMQQWSPSYKQKQEWNRKYKGPGFVGPSNKPINDTVRLFVGQIVVADSTGAWYPAEITALQPDGKVSVKFRGWGERTEVLPRSRLQLAHDGVDQPARPAELASDDGNPFEPQAVSKLRVWKDRSGKYSVEAEFLGLSNGNVLLRNKKDGREVSVPLSRLSDVDQAAAKQLAQP